jgi:midasin (ATPase involved in ribosome maturation)
MILEKRCAIAPSYAAKLVATMRELQRRRQVTATKPAASQVSILDY